MAGRAKILTDAQFMELLEYVGSVSREPIRDYVILMLSYKAGLRACEIAGLTWRDVMDASGKIGIESDEFGGDPCFAVPARIAKRGHGRSVPMHPALAAALAALKAAEGLPLYGTIIKSRSGTAMTSNALRLYLQRLYVKSGLIGCSSHSGRRTFITKALRVANNHDCSIKDVQAMVGHRYIDSTERYIEASPSRGKLVRSI